MKDIVIIGAGGMGKEAVWLIENINKVQPVWNILGFVESDEKSGLFGTPFFGYSIIGGESWLCTHNGPIAAVCAIGSSSIRKKVQDRLSQFQHISFPVLIDPSVDIHPTVSIGEGSMICKNARITVDIKIGKGALINTGACLGHDVVVGDYCTFLTNAMASGHSVIGDCCEIGSGAFILQTKSIVANTKVAPLASILTDITEPGMYSGNPARRFL